MHRVNADRGDDGNGRDQGPVRYGQNAGKYLDHRYVHHDQDDVGDEQRRNQTPDQIRLVLEQQRAGGDVVQRQRTHHHRGGTGAGNTQCQHRYHGAARRGTVGSFRRRQAAQITVAEATFLAGQTFLGHIGHRAGQGRPRPGQNAENEAHYAAADVGGEYRGAFLHIEQHAAAGLECRLAMLGAFQHGEDLTDAEQAQHQHHELDAVGQPQRTEGETVDATVGVDAHAGQQQANQYRDPGLHRFVTGHASQTDHGEDHQHEVFGRPEGNRPARQQGGKDHHADGGDEATDERTPGGNRQGDTRLALPRQRITIQGGHDRRGFAGDVQQNRGNPSAILTTQVDRCEQNQRRIRRQAESESDRNQQRHAIDRPQARQQPDDGAN